MAAFKPIALLLVVLAAGMASLTIPPAHATPPVSSEWGVSYISGLTAAATDYVSIAGQTGLVGIAYHTTANKVGFAIGDDETGFAVQSLDLDSGNTLSEPQLWKVSETTWAVVAKTATQTLRVYRTTDSGVTWTSSFSRTTTASGIGYSIYGSGTSLYLSWNHVNNGGTLEVSSNGGTSFGVIRTATGVLTSGAPTTHSGKTFLYTAAGTSTVPSAVSIVCTQDGAFWGSGCAPNPTPGNPPVAITSPAGSSSSAAIHVSESAYIVLQCYLSCSVGPQYRYAYGYLEGGASDTSYTVQSLSSIPSHLYSPSSISTFGHVAVLQMPNTGGYQPAVYYAASGTVPLAQLTTPLPTAAYGSIVLQNQRIYTALSNADVGGRLEVWSAPLPVADAFETDSWCSVSSIEDYGGDTAADFGYNYANDVEPFDTGFGSTDLSDGYAFTSQDDDFAYLGKGWEAPGATTVRTIFRIEAATEGQDSEFRVAYSFNSATPSATSRGDGERTQAFADHVEARFDEDGDDWKMYLMFSNGGGTLTQVGPVVKSFDPNTPHTFAFEVNTTGAGYARIINSESGNPILNQPMATSGVAGYAAFAGSDPMYSQWFVTGGNSALLSSFSYLDDHDDDGTEAEQSTCIFFEPDVVVKGAQGSQGGCAVDDDDLDGDCVPNTVDPDADGDGLCNDEADFSAGTPGAVGGCEGGDPDDDNDDVLDIHDDTPTGPGSGGAAGGDGSWQGAADNLDSVFGGGGGILLAILFVFLFAGFGHELMGLRGAAIGAVLGFAFGVFNDVVPPIITFLIVVSALAFIGFRFSAGRSGSEM